MQNKHKIIFMTLSISIFILLTLALIMMSLLIANEAANAFGSSRLVWSTTNTVVKPNGITTFETIDQYEVFKNYSFSNIAAAIMTTSFVLTGIGWAGIILFYKREGSMLPLIKNDKNFNFDKVLYFAPYFSWIFYLSFAPREIKIKPTLNSGYISGREKRVKIEEELIAGIISPNEFVDQMKDVK